MTMRALNRVETVEYLHQGRAPGRDGFWYQLGTYSTLKAARASFKRSESKGRDPRRMRIVQFKTLKSWKKMS